MTPQQFTLIRGDTRTIAISLVLPEGSEFDLGSVEHLRFTAKCRPTDGRAALSKSLGAGIEVTGEDSATLSITEADWDGWRGEEDLVWDLEARTATEVVTLAVGRLKVVGDVTREAP